MRPDLADHKVMMDKRREAKLATKKRVKQCPVCASKRIESFMMAVSPEYDPNAKLCRDCGYAWRQVNPNG